MNLPITLLKEIKGTNKRRDLLICSDYVEGYDAKEILQKRKNLNLTERRINQILANNAHFLNPRIGWSKAKRVHELQKLYKEAPQSKKDKADLLEQIRKELEGDAPLVDMSNHIHYEISWKNEVRENIDRLSAA